jgi:hypothetical protein
VLFEFNSKFSACHLLMAIPSYGASTQEFQILFLMMQHFGVLDSVSLGIFG